MFVRLGPESGAASGRRAHIIFRDFSLRFKLTLHHWQVHRGRWSLSYTVTAVTVRPHWQAAEGYVGSPSDWVAGATRTVAATLRP